MYQADVYDGIGEMFDSFHQVDAQMFIATSKPAIYAQEIIEHFGIHAHVERLFGSELDGTRSDKTSLLAHGLKTVGAKADCAVMVGDRKYDVVGAKANGMKVLGVTYGYGSVAELTKAGVDDIILSPMDLSEVVSKNLPLKD